MYTFLMFFFVILCVFLGVFILIQQGKGDLGLGSMGGSQMLFGGSGGQNFFERATWVMGAIFIFGSLGLTILKSKEDRASVLEGLSVPQQSARQFPMPQQQSSSDEDLEESAENIGVENTATTDEQAI